MKNEGLIISRLNALYYLIADLRKEIQDIKADIYKNPLQIDMPLIEKDGIEMEMARKYIKDNKKIDGKYTFLNVDLSDFTKSELIEIIKIEVDYFLSKYK